MTTELVAFFSAVRKKRLEAIYSGERKKVDAAIATSPRPNLGVEAHSDYRYFTVYDLDEQGVRRDRWEVGVCYSGEVIVHRLGPD